MCRRLQPYVLVQVTDELVDVLLTPLLSPGAADVVFDTLSYSAGMCMCMACACARHVHGVCMACAWRVHGVCMVCACTGPSLETRVYSAGPLPEPLLEDQRLQAAVQICFGEADPWTPPARVRALERFRSVRSVVGLPGVGHCPHDEAPELVNPMIVDFVRSLNVEAKAAA